MFPGYRALCSNQWYGTYTNAILPFLVSDFLKPWETTISVEIEIYHGGLRMRDIYGRSSKLVHISSLYIFMGEAWNCYTCLSFIFYWLNSGHMVTIIE